MFFNVVQRQKLNGMVEGILQIPGNFTKDILEMTIVFDCSLPKSYVQDLTGELVKILKSHSQVFRNVRLNTVKWTEDKNISNEITAMPVVQMGRYFEGYERAEGEKSLEGITGYLKKFHARSKLIFLIVDENLEIGDRGQVTENMNPFLKRKLIVLKKEGKGCALSAASLYFHQMVQAKTQE